MSMDDQAGRPIDDVAPEFVRRTIRRRRFPLGFVVAGVAIAIAVVYLIVVNTGTTADYYMTIGELHACTTCSTRAVRVAGVVKAGSIQRDNQSQVIRFVITEQSMAMPVVYSGVVPDIFQSGVQVVVEGHLQSDGVFQALTLLAKCPSKFQTATPSTATN